MAKHLHANTRQGHASRTFLTVIPFSPVHWNLAHSSTTWGMESFGDFLGFLGPERFLRDTKEKHRKLNSVQFSSHMRKPHHVTRVASPSGVEVRNFLRRSCDHVTQLGNVNHVFHRCVLIGARNLAAKITCKLVKLSAWRGWRQASRDLMTSRRCGPDPRNRNL